MEFSLCHTLPEASGLLEACRELDVSLLAYSPMAMGRLTGKYSGAAQPKGSRRFGAYPWDRIQPIVDRLGEVGAAHGGKTPAQVRWRRRVGGCVGRRQSPRQEPAAGAALWG